MNRPHVAALALVHHANQYLITDGYANREGISDVVAGYAAILRLHASYRIPVNLHLSGTLLESIAWHHPWFLSLVRDLHDHGLVELIGGAYGENVMPLFPREFNRRQLEEYLWLAVRHLGLDARELRVAWVPERIWSTRKLAPVFRDPGLANRGYRAVLLDDRSLFPIGQARSAFDDATRLGNGDAEHAAICADAYRIQHGHGLWVVPISMVLRYLVPPSRAGAWSQLEGILTSAGPNHLLTYADDLEKVAGIGPWSKDTPRRYESFLRWLSDHDDVAVVRLCDWLETHPPQASRRLENGTYYELACAWAAGESYRGWWDDPTFAPQRCYLEEALADVNRADATDLDPKLRELAWKHLLASSYETAWHDVGHEGSSPAPWAVALASHARAAHVIVAAAHWLASDRQRPTIAVVDLDRDGEEEVVLTNDRVYVVLSPRWGGRVIYMITGEPSGGVSVVGNTADDWNWQAEINRFMDVPPNHPGAFVDVDHRHDRHIVSRVCRTTNAVSVELMDVEPGSARHGSLRAFLLTTGLPGVLLCARLRDADGGVALESCLSPDYYRLLREGQAAMAAIERASVRGARNGSTCVWLALQPAEETTWGIPGQPLAGHGINFRTVSWVDHFHVLLGTGPISEAERAEQYAYAVTTVHGLINRRQHQRAS